MKYFAVFLAMKDEEKSQTFRPQHLEFLDKMRHEDKVVMNGKFSDGAGGLVIYKAENLEQVKRFVSQDPYVIEEARGCTIHEWEMVTDYQLVK
ncbi:YciI family protein [Sporosarcina cascadiensis]|uniref:YciI family protein n=1 Tax=Sporosarcina cascadiensis TaxID=2660747 RepID=UPI00129A246A|nr:YciI family protein [Sporosarcina cascadiensis]